MFLGIDVGTSSIKVCVLDADTGKHLWVSQSPDSELPILSIHPGFAEQDPNTWWEHTCKAILQIPSELRGQVEAIGIGYQMHGLVLVDAQGDPLRNAIIWCDSRAAIYGEQAFNADPDYCLTHLLNSPGNFTAAKLAWVAEHEPENLRMAKYAVLPGDFIALKLTGEAFTTNSGLSEMALWDFVNRSRADRLLDIFQLRKDIFPKAVPTCSDQGQVLPEIAGGLGLPSAARVTFRAGDQPTNALALGVLNPGEVAATAGTSGVLYSVTDQPAVDPDQRVNTFLHVNRSTEEALYGVLCCVNGCGSLMNWLRNRLLQTNQSYTDLNSTASQAPVGSEGLLIHPFGNGAERILGNRNPGASITCLDFTRHTRAHFLRAAQEGIAFALYYGVENLPTATTIRASKANLFLSPLFAQTVADITGATVEILDTQGVFGAAWGAAMGALQVERPSLSDRVHVYAPAETRDALQEAYQHWRKPLLSSPSIEASRA